MRNLVTVRTITAVDPIPNADAIECVTIDDGWQCVAKKGEFQVGSNCVYFEVDCFVDHTDPRFAFLAKNAIKWNGLEGARIKTVKLRGQVSQGLALPVKDFAQELCDGTLIVDQYLLEYIAIVGVAPSDEEFEKFLEENYPYGILATLLNVTKWEKILPASLMGTARGSFPSFIPKTDQERLQNLFRKVAADTETVYEVTMKVDGSSGTFYLNDDIFGVCSRNLDLVDTEGNTFWEIARRYDIQYKLRDLGLNLALQGEVWGAGINGNWERALDTNLAIFDVWDIANRRYYGKDERHTLIRILELPHVPFIELRRFDFKTIQEAVEYAKGPSIHNKIREGVVWKSMDGTKSFKIISPDFLLASDS